MELYDLDERQKKIRWRAGFHTAFLLMGLVLADGVLSQYRPWAEPAMGAVILLTAATAFFATVTIYRGAYQVENRRTRRWMHSYLAVGGLNLLAWMGNWLSGGWQPVENGLLTTDLLPLVLGGLFLYVYLLWWGKSRRDRRLEADGDTDR